MALMYVASAGAQVPLHLSDDFGNPHRSWTWPAEITYSSPESSSLFSQTDPTATSLILREVLIRQKDDFLLESSFLPSGSGLSYAWGIVWSCTRDRQSYLALLVRADGKFCVRQTVGGVHSFLVPWTKSRRIKLTGDDPILLSVERKGRKLYFAIDGKEIADATSPRLWGKYHGLILEGAGAFTVQQFSVYRQEHQIIHATGRFYNATRRPLDSTINTVEEHETAPVLGPDRHTLYFSRGKDSTLRSSALMTSRVVGDSMWGPPHSVFSQTIPGRTEVFRQKQEKLELLLMPGTASSGLAISQNIDSAWQMPRRQFIPTIGEQPGLMTAFQDRKDKILLISAERKNGYGGQDLYVLFRKRDGSWSQPKNLGPDINTFEEEFAPWLSPDGKFLIFTSGGHPGYGGWDLYRSERLTETWTRWSTPENLGPRINTHMDEAWYHPWKEDRAYIAVQDSNRGDFDLYGLRLPQDPADLPIVRLAGQIINKKNGEPLPGKVLLREIPGDSLRDILEVPIAQNGFRSYVGYQQAYQMIAMVDGYFPLTDTLDLRAVDKFRDVRKDVYVAPVEVGDVIRLDKVYFERAEAILLEDSFAELDRLVALMRAIPTLRIEIHGHTDDIGDPGELLILSESRAERVLWYLADHGIASGRMLARGFGANQPVADNRNPATRPLNRRVEFVIVSR